MRFGEAFRPANFGEANVNKQLNADQVSNGAREIIESGLPYIATVKVLGVADILLHAWNNAAVAEKSSGGGKGSRAKKTDNLESYVYRNDAGEICCPGEYLRGSIINAAKFRQDPRSPRKSAMDLYKAGVVALTPLASFGSTKWDYEDARRVTVQRAGITRVRPAFKAGWSLEFDLLVTLPEYISPTDLLSIVESAGRLVGLADFRPTFGRFGIAGFSVRPV